MAEIDDAPNCPELRLSAPVPLAVERGVSAFAYGESVPND